MTFWSTVFAIALGMLVGNILISNYHALEKRLVRCLNSKKQKTHSAEESMKDILDEGFYFTTKNHHRAAGFK